MSMSGWIRFYPLIGLCCALQTRKKTWFLTRYNYILTETSLYLSGVVLLVGDLYLMATFTAASGKRFHAYKSLDHAMIEKEQPRCGSAAMRTYLTAQRSAAQQPLGPL